MPDIAHMQEVIAAEGLDGWLLFDFRRSNLIAHRVLGLPPHAFFSRRWMYYIPAQGAPTRLVSAVEAHVLDMLPGERRVYRTWREYQALLGEMLTGAKRVAMEYVPDNGIPYVSLVDAGTVELVRSLGPEVVSSADFTQRFEAVLTPAQIESHREAGRALLRARDGIFDWLRDQLSRDAELTEYAVQQEFSQADARRGTASRSRRGPALRRQRQRGQSPLQPDRRAPQSCAQGRSAPAGLQRAHAR